MVRYRVGMDYFPFFLADFAAGFLAALFFLAAAFLVAFFAVLFFFAGALRADERPPPPATGGWPAEPPVVSPESPSASAAAAAKRAARCAPFDVFLVAPFERFDFSVGSFSATASSVWPSAPASISTTSDHRMW